MYKRKQANIIHSKHDEEHYNQRKKRIANKTRKQNRKHKRDSKMERDFHRSKPRASKREPTLLEMRLREVFPDYFAHSTGSRLDEKNPASIHERGVPFLPRIPFRHSRIPPIAA